MSKPQERVRDLKVWALLGLVGTLAVFGWLPCPFAGVVGLPCPGCGLGRATLALLEGDLAQAFRWHPLVFVLLPLLAIVVLHGIGTRGKLELGAVLDPSLESPRQRWARYTVNLLLLILLGAMLGLWIARFLGCCGGPVPVRRWF